VLTHIRIIRAITGSSAGQSSFANSDRTSFHFERMIVSRVTRETIKPKKYNKLVTETRESVEYQVMVQPCINVSTTGLDWSIALGSNCSVHDEECAKRELESRKDEMAAAGQDALYFNGQVRAWGGSKFRREKERSD
jgi:hypothetical protein